MGKFDGLLIVSDLDGTLLRGDKSISKKNKAAIKYFCSEGGRFTFITGRSPKGALPVLEVLMPNAPIGCLNGCGIYDACKKEYTFKRSIDTAVFEIVRYIDEEFPTVGIELVGFEDIYFAKKSPSTEKHKTDERLPDLLCDYNNPPCEPAKILLGAKPYELAPMIQALKTHPLYEDFSFILSDKEYFEILPKGASKGFLLDEFSRLLDIPKSRIISVGDNDNDVSMLGEAGIGIAVANASENAKAAADIITVSNEEDAIAKIIGDIELGKINLIK